MNPKKVENIRRRKRHVGFYIEDDDGGSNLNDRELRKAKRRHLWGNPGLGKRSVRMTCSNCRYAIDTFVVFKYTWKFWMFVIFLTVIGLCFIPVIYRLGQNGVHYCPVCTTYLGHSGTKYL